MKKILFAFVLVAGCNSSKPTVPAAPLAEVTVWEGPDCSATYRP